MTEIKPELTVKEKRAWVANYLRRTPVQNDKAKVTKMCRKVWTFVKVKDETYENAKELFE